MHDGFESSLYQLKMINSLLRKIYFSPTGKVLARVYNSFFSTIHKPRMLWGYIDQNGKRKEKTRISSSAIFYAKNNISIEDHVYIGHYCILDGIGKIKINEGTQISSRVAIYTHSSHIAIRLYGYHYTDIDEGSIEELFVKPVNIGKFVYIGTNATILSGVNIGDGALIAAGSIVKENVKAFQCVAGCPAQVIGSTKKMDKKYLSNPEIKKWYEEWQHNDSSQINNDRS